MLEALVSLPNLNPKHIIRNSWKVLAICSLKGEFLYYEYKETVLLKF